MLSRFAVKWFYQVFTLSQHAKNMFRLLWFSRSCFALIDFLDPFAWGERERVKRFMEAFSSIIKSLKWIKLFATQSFHQKAVCLLFHLQRFESLRWFSTDLEAIEMNFHWIVLHCSKITIRLMKKEQHNDTKNLVDANMKRDRRQVATLFACWWALNPSKSLLKWKFYYATKSARERQQTNEDCLWAVKNNRASGPSHHSLSVHWKHRVSSIFPSGADLIMRKLFKIHIFMRD